MARGNFLANQACRKEEHGTGTAQWTVAKLGRDGGTVATTAQSLHCLDAIILRITIIMIKHVPAQRLGMHQEFQDARPPLLTILSYFAPTVFAYSSLQDPLGRTLAS